MSLAIYPDQPPRLGVNIDHVTTLRQLRKTPYPDLWEAAAIVVKAGADQITVHPREDQRHVQPRDVEKLKAKLSIPLNMEMAIAEEMVQFAEKVKTQWCCIVPEKREELTTEGGLDVKKNLSRLREVIPRLKRSGSKVSLFIEPDIEVIKISKELNIDALEFHTGRFGLAAQKVLSGECATEVKTELDKIQKACVFAREIGLKPHAGHGIDYKNIRKLVELVDPKGRPLIEEYNIGHSIICRGVMVGLAQAVREMKAEVLAP